jgi:Exo-beta-D-glucosaminidase Ig-fold domain/Glycosyl hydrolases family 2/Concanavalin A-like lectin/glucanases superfamily/Glycosyl hydrolases family 2, sugar binding domain/Glycosyl hydrolases family 2, TIM barrel domain
MAAKVAARRRILLSIKQLIDPRLSSLRRYIVTFLVDATHAEVLQSLSFSGKHLEKSMREPAWRRLVNLLLAMAAFCSGAQAQTAVTVDPPFYGPFNGVFLPDGDGLEKPLGEHDSVLHADSPWSLYGWVRLDEDAKTPTLIAGFGEAKDEYARYLALDSGKLILWGGQDNSLEAAATIAPRQWHLLAATFDGSHFHLFSDGQQVASGELALGSVSAVLRMAPPFLPWPTGKHFGGKIAALTLLREALSPDRIRQLQEKAPDFSLVQFEEGSKPWRVQIRGQAGYRAPQDPSTLPRSRAPVPAAASPLFRPRPGKETGVHMPASREDRWTLGDWRLVPAPEIHAQGAELSRPAVDTGRWMQATVPGTVLTTMIDRGVYPDPDYGLNNLAIPESLNRQDYWYRTEFKTPAGLRGRKLTLTFEGINYKAEVWLNGQLLGTIRGAFMRGTFDITSRLQSINVLAVKVSPPPHPGIPQEQSIKGGPGENGGIMCLDGPTFVATEGWDWIPAIRDRDAGLWQEVSLHASGDVRIGDLQVVTSLPLPETNRASVAISVPLENTTGSPVHGTLHAAFEQVDVVKEVTVAPGQTEENLTAAEFPQLTVASPHLWWPNGYGKQELYHLELTFGANGRISDTKRVRFGIREVTYELSLLDSRGRLRRLEYSPSEAMAKRERVVDVSHNGIREIPAFDPPPPDLPPEAKAWWKSWVASLVPGGEASSAVRMLADAGTGPFLVIKVNGVRIACRGGNWGMDDSRKRVSRQRLEPYFRLHHDAHLNIIRNWVGQNTEETFYELADEYGLLVWNDFWESTQDYNVEAEDPGLFLANARDTILRFRNHPSIVMWCGRNEGVPQPIINEGLAELVRTLDGTRYYSPSSNQVNLQNSGPYKYMDPTLYYTTLNHGFSVETGTPSFSTLESFRAAVPEPDQWPIGDVWAYHDWHASGNGEMAPFMAEIQAEFGAPTGLDDFERKAQMLNYVDHRAIFEGMNQHLWAPNSGRLLWMTQPTWPSNTWQIISHDYDTQASYYGVRKACEPVHVQLDLSNFTVSVVNTTAEAHSGMSVRAKLYSLDNRVLLEREMKKDVAADSTSDAFRLELAPLFSNGVLLIRLALLGSDGQPVSDNLYWLAESKATYRQLNHLRAVTLSTSLTYRQNGESVELYLHLENKGAVSALQSKLTLVDSRGERILPVYYSDNYVSLLPGETREVVIRYSRAQAEANPQVAIRGWNVPSAVIPVSQKN